ncbi:MAG TPA: SCP2 sterol-binding domain-containing protein [Burkholderiaceae bacterium]|nr:SCP2 sterol-binding domain-containing protein [Burkholderiaceae bacterium]
MKGIQAFTLPAPIGRLLGSLPKGPGSRLFVTGLNLALSPHLPTDTCAMLEGRALRIEVADAELRFDYTWRVRAFRAADHGGRTPDLTIRANTWDYLQLIQRGEDPDTLFFSRRLVMEGDTELGLLVKNTLDSLDMEILKPARVLGNLVSGNGLRLPDMSALHRGLAGLPGRHRAP